VRTQYLRGLNELLFSLNLALLVISVGSVRLKYPLLTIGSRVLDSVYTHLPSLGLSALRDGEPNRQSFAALVLVFAAVLLVVFRITSRFALTDSILRLVPGIFGVIGLPVTLELLQSPPPLLFIEAFVAAVCALLYLFGKWRLPWVIGILLMTLHFVFWSSGVRNIMWFWPVYPAVGFCSVLVWTLYVKQQRLSTAASLVVAP
jgi:hypothetical protein